VPTEAVPNPRVQLNQRSGNLQNANVFDGASGFFKSIQSQSSGQNRNQNGTTDGGSAQNSRAFDVSDIQVTTVR
jgi:hypothetical protein